MRISIIVNKLIANNVLLYSLIPSSDWSLLSAEATKYNKDDDINTDNNTAWKIFQLPVNELIDSNRKYV